jgi:predicted Zn-dependent protease
VTRRGWRRELTRVAAPVALLAVVTAGVLVLRADLRGRTGSDRSHTATAAVERARQPARKGFYAIQPGDTLGGVAARFRTTVAHLLVLNPGIDSSSLQIGQRIRVR